MYSKNITITIIQLYYIKIMKLGFKLSAILSFYIFLELFL